MSISSSFHWFQRVSTIDRMMELLNIDLKLAADLMAFLDLDDSGDVNWQEFVRGVCSDQFAVLFPRLDQSSRGVLKEALYGTRRVGSIWG